LALFPLLLFVVTTGYGRPMAGHSDSSGDDVAGSGTLGASSGNREPETPTVGTNGTVNVKNDHDTVNRQPLTTTWSPQQPDTHPQTRREQRNSTLPRTIPLATFSKPSTSPPPGTASPKPQTPGTGDQNDEDQNQKLAYVVGGVVGGICVLLLTVCFCICCCR